MQYTIQGFSQDIAIKLGLSANDLILLNWISRFTSSNKVRKIIIENKLYYWIHYEKVCEELPIISKKVDTMYRIFNNLVKSNVLIRHTKKNKTGTYSFFAFGNEYDSLISNTIQDNTDNEILDINKLSELGKKSESQSINSEKNPSKSDVTRKKIRTKDLYTNKKDLYTNKHIQENNVCENISTEIKNVLGQEIGESELKKLIKNNGIETIKSYISNWELYREHAQDQVSFFIHCIKNKRTPPIKLKQTTSQIPQYANFEQREYSEEYYEKFYANLQE